MLLTYSLVYLAIGFVLSLLMVDDNDRRVAFSGPVQMIAVMLLWPLVVINLFVRGLWDGLYIKRRGRTIFQWKGLRNK